jgi:hypothetical protein
MRRKSIPSSLYVCMLLCLFVWLSQCFALSVSVVPCTTLDYYQMQLSYFTLKSNGIILILTSIPSAEISISKEVNFTLGVVFLYF